MSSSESEAGKVRLHIKALTEATEIRVLDARFAKVDLPAGNSGEVEVDLPQGLYEIGFRDGAVWQHTYALLQPDGSPVQVQQPGLQVPRGGMPLETAEDDVPAAAVPTLHPTGSDVVIVVRDLHRREAGPAGATSDPQGWTQGLSLFGEGQATTPGVPAPVPGRAAGLHFEVAPGAWRIRLDTGVEEQLVEMPLIVCPGWRTLVEFPVTAYGDPHNRRAALSQARVRMINPASVPFEDDAHARHLEVNALQSLADGRVLHGPKFNEMLERLVAEKFRYPMLGLYAGYLLPCQNAEEVGLLRTVVSNLAPVLERGPDGNLDTPGFTHPDLLALRLRLALLDGDTLDTFPVFDFPPMLMVGWNLMLKGARRAHRLVPRGSLTELVAGRLRSPGPWVTWALFSAPGRMPSARRSAATALVGTLRGAQRFAKPFGASASVGEEGGRGLEAALSIDLGKRGSGEVHTFAEACEIIDTALHHRVLREWYRAASLPRAEPPADPTATAGPAGDAGPFVEITLEEQRIAETVHVIASDEERQAVLDWMRLRERATDRSPWTLDRLAAVTRLPPATVERAALDLCADLLEEGEHHNLDLRKRSPMARPELILPYDPEFLGDGFTVPLPQLSEPLLGAAYGKGAVVDYTHYSLVMHAERRVAVYTAHNVDASRIVQVSGGHKWQMDERVGEFQLGPETYSANKLDKGHLVRRQDVLWGSVPEAKLANKATFFYTNAAPQHENFNQDEWVTLENWVLSEATDFSYRLCVFTGPVLRSDDPVLADLPPNLRSAFRVADPARIPAAFWKVIVLRPADAGGDDLSAVAFAMRQSEMWNDKEGKKLLALKVHQVTLEAIESWTGLDFGELKNVDELAWAEDRGRPRSIGEEPEWPLVRGASDIVLSGSGRRARGGRALRHAGASAPDAARRVAGVENAPWRGPAVETSRSGCGCGSRDDFDAREAVAAVSRDLARLTETVATQARGAGTGATGRSAGAARDATALPDSRTLPDTLDTTAGDADATARVEAFANRVPGPMQEKARAFARTLVTQADIARGRVAAPPPSELERIVGGDTVPPGAFTSCCCIGSPTDWFCTGVVVAPQVILTAAHCGREITRVMVGGNQVKPWLSPDARIVAVRRVVVHPSYRPHPYNENDITVLILAEAANVPPVPLATVDQLRDADEVNLVGFGYNDPQRPVGFGTKRQVRVPRGPTKLSDADDLADLESYLGFHADYEFVAGRKGLGRDSCNGDSGGPAYLRTATGFAVAGLTSRATREAAVNCGDGGLYVRPDQFRAWIASVLSEAGVSVLP